MEQYCAFLRGINVNGTSMKMEEVKSVFTKAGMKNVSSVLATGNILFESDIERYQLRSIIKENLSQHFNYDANLFIKTKKDVENILHGNPFDKNGEDHIYIFISENGVQEDLLKIFSEAKIIKEEHAKIANSNFYWKIKKGLTLDSDFGKVLGKKIFKDKMTSRNINTMEKILLKLKSI